MKSPFPVPRQARPTQAARARPRAAWSPAFWRRALLAAGLFASLASQGQGLDGASVPAMWVKGETLTGSLSDGAPVTAWSNSGSGPSYVTNPAHGSTDPTLANAADSKLNFNATVRFGGNGSLKTTSLFGTNAYTALHAFTVVKPGAATQSAVLNEAAASGGSINVHLPFNGGDVYWDAGSTSAARLNFTPPVGSYTSHHLWSFYGDAANTAAFAAPQVIRRNAATLATKANSVVGATGNNSVSYLGTLQGFPAYQGDVAEVALYLGNSFDAAAYNRIESYLALKFGITQTPGAAINYTSASGATLWTGQTTYQNNIAGISMQTGNGLNQTISRSSNTAQAQITVAHGAAFPSAGTLLNGQSGAAIGTSDDAFVWGDNNQTATSTTTAGAFTISSRIWRAQLTGSSIGQVTLCVPASLVPVAFTVPALLAAADAGMSSNLSATPLGSLQTGVCPDVQGGASKVDGYVVTVNTAALAPSSGVGFFTLAAPYMLSVNKTIAGTGRANALDQFTTQIRTGGAAGTVVSSDTASPGGGATTTGAGTTATALVAYTGSTATTYTLTESNAGPTPLSAYASSIVCSNAAGGSSTVIPTSATAFDQVNGLNITPQAGDAITCTITNAPYPTLTLAKAWVNGKSGDAISVTTTGGANNASISNASTGGTGSGNTTAGGTSVVVQAGNTITLPAETFTSGSGANYSSTVSCNNDTATVSNAALPASFTVSATDTSITCTYSNARTSATLSLGKAWVNGKSGDAISVSTTGGTNNASISNACTGGAGGNTTAGGSALTVYAGDVISLPAETFTSGSGGNYTSTVSCNNSATPVSNAAPGAASFTVSPSDTAITCTYSNTRKSATLTLAKAWVNGKSGDAISVSTTGGSNSASISNASTGGAGGNTTAGGTAVTVLAGEVISLPIETFTVGDAANYTSTVSCNNSSSPVSNATPGAASFTVSGADTALTCTYTNTRKSATLTLAKAWTNGISTDAISVTTTGGSNNASISNTSTGGAGGNTTAGGTAVTVYAGEVISLPVETFTSGAVTNYTSTVSCNNSATPVSNATPGAASFTVAASDTAITCTYSNQLKGATLTLAKAWVNGKSGDAVSVSTTGGSNNASISNASTGGAGGNTTAGGTPVNVLVGDTITLPAETFSSGSSANYTSTVSCNNSATPVSNAAPGASFTVSASDTAITCTYTNTRKSATLTLAKVWAAGSAAGNATTLSTTGLLNNASTGASVATAIGNTTTGSPVTVYAGETATFPAETLSPGQVSHYSTMLACTGAAASLSGSNGQASNTLSIGAADAGQAIACSYTNTRTSPPGLDGLAEPAMWVKADALTGSLSNGSPVTAWPNSGVGPSYVTDPAHSATDPTLANAADSKLNFNATVNFGGTGDLRSSSLTGTSSYAQVHVFTVVNPTLSSGTFFDEATLGVSGALRGDLPYSDGNVYWTAGSLDASATGQRLVFAAPTGTVGSYHQWSLYGDNANAAAFSAPIVARRDALTVASKPLGTVSFTGNNGNHYLGASQGATPYQGKVAEFALYLGDSLDAAAYNRIESYLSLKYGLTQNPGAATNYTSSSGATLWTGQTTYQHNIAGISMQTGNGLNQTISRSSNTAQAQLSIANGASFPSAGTLLSGQSGAALSTSDDGLVWGDNDQAATSTGLVGTYTTSSRIWRAQLTGASIAQVTLCVPASLVPATFAQPQLIAAGDAALSSNVSLTSLGTVQTGVCPDVQGGASKVDGYVVTVNTASLAPSSGVGFFTLTAPYQLSVNKTIAGAGRINAADQFSTQIRTGGAAGTVVSSDTASPGGGATTSGVSTTATAAAPFTSNTGATTYTLTESNAGPTPLSSYASSILCSNTTAGSSTVIPTSATAFDQVTGLNLTPQAGDAITCTLTNTPHPTLTLAKAWVNGISTDAISVSTTGGSNNASISHASTGGAGGTTTGGGTAVVVHVGDVITLPIETFTSGASANYTSTVSCNNSTSPLTNATLPAQFTVSGTDTALTCTYTNTRNSATLTLAKAWVNGKSTDAISVTTTGGSNNATLSHASTGGAGGNTTAGGTPVTVYAGEVLSLPVETFTNGSAANYKSTVSCNNSATPVSNATPGAASFTVSGADTALTCTYTNSRKSATSTWPKPGPTASARTRSASAPRAAATTRPSATRARVARVATPRPAARPSPSTRAMYSACPWRPSPAARRPTTPAR